MSHANYTYTNCVGEIPDTPLFGEGVVTVRDAAINSTVSLRGFENTEIHLRGGAHSLFSVWLGAHNFSGNPGLLNNNYNTPDEIEAGSSKIFRVDIGDNVNTFNSSIVSETGRVYTYMRDAAILNAHLRGTWSMKKVRIWGNVGFDLETIRRIPLGHLMDVHPEPLENLKKLGYPEEVPDIILSYVQPDYGLWQLVENFDKYECEKAYRDTLNAAQQVLKSGCVINQFCAFKDVHDRPNCRCALYYPLLLELNPLALMYFVKAGAHTRKMENIISGNVTHGHLEGSLSALLLEREVERARYSHMQRKMEEPVKVVRRVTPARFEKFLKTAGIKNTSMLWRAP